MKKIIFIFLISFLSVLCGCKKFVDINPPKTALINSVVFQNNATANAAMLTVYGQQFADGNINPYVLALYTGLSSDELKNGDSGLLDIYSNNIVSTSSNSRAHEVWKSAYNIIYTANSVYEGCAKSTALTPAVKDQLMGEALFVRSYWLFYLTNLYGDIPLALTTDYRVNNTLFRKSAAQEVYPQIVSDLKIAQTLLNDNYTGIDGLTTSTERIRANKAVVTAFLARVYLYAGDYLNAEKQASAIIDNSSVYSLVPLAQVFQKNNKEAIWQIMATNNPSYNTQEGAFVVTAVPVTQGKATLSTQLLNAFEPGDLRKSTWVGKYTGGTPVTDYYFPAKYKDIAGSTLIEYSVSIRLAEMYLIRSEARNEQNNIIGAISDLNTLRDRSRGPVSIDTPNPLPALKFTLTKDQVKSAIIHERQIELFAEYGHRWFDLKRTKTIDAVMSAATANKGYTWLSDKQLWPVPNTEILNNPNLTQNKSYQ